MTEDPSVITSARLRLVTFPPDVLQLSLAGDALTVERRMGFHVPPLWYAEVGLLRMRLRQVTQDPAYLPWSVRAMCLKADPRMIGYIGFHTMPGDPYLKEHAPSGVEFGYEVFPEHRRRGYAREACRAVMEWAFKEHAVTEFVVSISPGNIPSVSLARSLGFEKVGSHIDEVDGPEDVFRLKHPGNRLP